MSLYIRQTSRIKDVTINVKKSRKDLYNFTKSRVLLM